jgi:hypothetical protein
LLDTTEIKEAENLIKEYAKKLKSSDSNTNKVLTQPADTVKSQSTLQSNVVEKLKNNKF